MNFLDIQFPQELLPYFNKSIKYATSIGKMQNGREFRKSILKDRIIMYSLLKSIKQAEKITLLEDFFHTVHGQTFSFKMLDATDYKLENIPAKIIDAHTVQIQKINQFGTFGKSTEITKPKDGTVQVFQDGALLVGGYSVDYLTGIIYFNEDISLRQITIACEYFKHVRFNSDSISFVMRGQSSFEVENIEIIEVLN